MKYSLNDLQVNFKREDTKYSKSKTDEGFRTKMKNFNEDAWKKDDIQLS
ncbi:hypothetical protein [Abyssisolibacter fermentans]|nr:hypothetical protein [Abyssisolibacter fermentans]